MRGRPREFDRDEVLERAMHVFWRRGYDSTSISDLVNALGIGRQSIYGAFGDKRRLFEESLALYARTELQSFVDALEGPGSPRERICGMLDYIRLLAAREPRNGCLVIRTAASQCGCDADLAKHAAMQTGRIVDALTNTLREAQSVGQLAPCHNARALARTAVSTFNGMAILAPFEDDLQAAEDVLRTLEELLTGRVRDRSEIS